MSTGIYTVAMVPITAGAKRVTNQVNLEYEAESASAAIAQAKADCQWQRPNNNFAWSIISRRVLSTVTPSGDTKPLVIEGDEVTTWLGQPFPSGDTDG